MQRHYVESLPLDIAFCRECGEVSKYEVVVASAGAGSRPLIQEGQVGTRSSILRRGIGYIHYMCKANRVLERDMSNLDLEINLNLHLGTIGGSQ